MSSEISVSEEAQGAIRELGNLRKFRFVLLKLSDDLQTIVVDKTGERDTSHRSFLRELPKDEPRFIFYDFELKPSGDVPRPPQMIFINWTPDSASMQLKMQYSSCSTLLRDTVQAKQMFAAAKFEDLSQESLQKMCDH